VIDIPSVVIATIQANAAQGVSRGKHDTDTLERAYVQHCTTIHWRTGTLLLFTRDVTPSGTHLLHLGISFRPKRPEIPPDVIGNVHTALRLGATLPMVPFEPYVAGCWARLLYGDDSIGRVWQAPAVTQGTRLAGQPATFWLPCNAEWEPRTVLDPAFEAQVRAMKWIPWGETQFAGQIADADPGRE